jgi:hypothetical protein
MNANYRSLVQKLDLGGMPQREERREAVKKQEQAQQQVAVDAVAAYRRGLRSYLEGAYREVDVERLKRDPAELYFRLANSSIETA